MPQTCDNNDVASVTPKAAANPAENAPAPRFLRDRKGMRRSLTTVILVVALCLGVWLWGKHRRVDVSLMFNVEIQAESEPSSMALTFFNEDQKAVHEVQLPVAPYLHTGSIQTTLRPGNYRILGMVKTKEGTDHAVEQHIHVPDENVTITVYLRDK